MGNWKELTEEELERTVGGQRDIELVQLDIRGDEPALSPGQDLVGDEIRVNEGPECDDDFFSDDC